MTDTPSVSYKVVIHGFGPSSEPVRLDPSSFVMKLLGFCIYNKIPFTFKAGGKFSPNSGRCPWAKITTIDSSTGKEVSTKIVEDSQRCILELSKLFGIDMDSHLTPEQKVQSEALRLLVDNTLYPVTIRSAWVDNKEAIVRTMPLAVPDFARSLVINLVRSEMIKFLNEHGNGDLTDEESREAGAAVHREIARLLGDKKFIFSNEKPSLIDCVLVRYFDQVEIDSIPFESRKKIFDEHPNLLAYGKRLTATLFPEGEECTAKRIEGLKYFNEAKSAATKAFVGVLSGAVVLVSVAGYFGVKLLKSYKWI